MNESTTTIRDASLLAVAATLGIGLAVIAPWLGLPMAAAGLAGLAYRGHLLVATIVSALGVAAVGVLGMVSSGIFSVSDVVYAAPAVLAVLLAIALLPRIDWQLVGILDVGLLTAASMGAAYAAARAAGTTIVGQSAKDAATVSNGVIQMLGTSATPDVITSLKSSAAMMQNAVWSTFFETAVIVAVLTIAAIVWSARRSGRALSVPSLGQIDLSPHVLWPFVVGLFALAASYGAFAGSSVLGIVGLNLVMCARTLFFLQGLSVSAGVLDRSRVGRGGRILALAALAALDAFTFALSFAGLLDFWVNFRKLPRDGSPAVPAPERPGN